MAKAIKNATKKAAPKKKSAAKKTAKGKPFKLGQDGSGAG